MQLLGEITGCCSAEACSLYGLPASPCRLEDLPYTFDGTYYNGFFSGPLQVAGALSASFMLQELSGLEAAWGNLSKAPLRELTLSLALTPTITLTLTLTQFNVGVICLRGL